MKNNNKNDIPQTTVDIQNTNTYKMIDKMIFVNKHMQELKQLINIVKNQTGSNEINWVLGSKINPDNPNLSVFETFAALQTSVKDILIELNDDFDECLLNDEPHPFTQFKDFYNC